MKLPELGENIEGGDVLRVMVKAGDAIKKDQAVLELETDKATIEVPSSATGVVKEVKVKPGEKVKVGQTIFIVDENGAGAAAKAEGAVSAEARLPSRSRAKRATQKPVGSRRRRTKPAKADAKPEKRKADVVEMKPSKQAARRRSRRSRRSRRRRSDGASIPAAPSARRLARELGVNIQDIQGSGPGGRISMDDVTAYARRLMSGAGAGASVGGGGERRCPTSASGERSSASR